MSENSDYSTTIHNLLILEHNRLVEKLRDVNPEWSNNTLFEEAKRITIAQLQHITYNEFIPNVIGHVSDFFNRLTINSILSVVRT